MGGRTSGKALQGWVSVGRGSGVSVYRVSQGYWEEHTSSLQPGGTINLNSIMSGSELEGFGLVRWQALLGFESRVQALGLEEVQVSGLRL